jgi:site-specific recombinase XerD
MKPEILASKVLNALSAVGYTENTLKTRVSIYRKLSKYMTEQNLSEYTPDVGVAFVPIVQEGYTQIEGKRLCRLAIDNLNNYISGIAFETPRGKRKREAIGIYPEMDEYLGWCAFKGLAPGTLNNYHDMVKRIADGFKQTGLESICQINMKTVVDFCQTLTPFSLCEKHNRIFVLKNLLHYLFDCGYTTTDLSLSVPQVRYDQKSRIPSVYTQDEVNRLLNEIVTEEPASRRDYAMALIAARTGMRSSDIAALTFESIDWDNDKIEILQKKTGVSLSVALPVDVGEAIIDYIFNYRPISDSTYIFLTHIPPYNPIKPGRLNHATAKALEKAQINVNRRKKGPHALRHSYASNLISRGVSLKTISDELGHQSIQTTTIYTKIDTENLKNCALNVPEYAVKSHSVDETLEQPVIGDLAPHIVNFIKYKRSFGQNADKQFRILRNFAAFSLAYDLSQQLITEQLATDWLGRRFEEKPNSFAYRASVIRQFCEFLRNLGYDVYVPELLKSHTKKSSFKPHIYSEDEIVRFFKAADIIDIGVTSSVVTKYEMVVPTLFRILLGCGLRISEALKLKRNDVDFGLCTLRLLDSKNNKDRLVVMDESLKKFIEKYMEVNAELIGEEGYIFAKDNGTPLAAENAYKWFRKTLESAGIPHGGKGYGPRMHDFRHTFAVRSLNKMLADGKSLYVALPILKDYLGHSDISATEKYVRIVQWMFPDIIAITNRVSEKIIPDLGVMQ